MNRVQLQCYNLKALAGLYKISTTTIKKKFKDLKIKRPVGNIYTIAQVQEIFDKMGWPEEKTKD